MFEVSTRLNRVTDAQKSEALGHELLKVQEECSCLSDGLDTLYVGYKKTPESAV